MELIPICLSVEEGTEAPRQWHKGCGEQPCPLSLQPQPRALRAPSLRVRAALCQLMARLGPGRLSQHIWERKSCSHTPLAMKPAPGINKDSSCEGFRAQMITTSSSESARLATAVQTAVNSKPSAPCQSEQPRIAAPPFPKNTFIMPTLPGKIFLCLLFHEPVSSFSPPRDNSVWVCTLALALPPKAPHLPCARGCKGRVGCPGWMVSSPWRCRDRRCCCCNCCICKSCCWKANCCVATCCCWGWKKKTNKKN